MITRAIILLTFALAGCQVKPAAPLKLVSLQGKGDMIDVYFESEVNVLDIYADSSFRKNISTNFICSLADHPSFSTESDHRNVARGLVEPTGRNRQRGEQPYQFKASLLFIDPVRSSRETSVYPSNSELAKLLKTRQELKCKVRVLAYLTPPYFSETLLIPTDNIGALLGSGSNR